MVQAQPYNFTKRVFKITSVLTFISVFVVVVIGYSIGNMNNEVKKLKAFLEETTNLQPNFEQSLQLYTESTEESMEFVNSLRPDNETEYIQFIADVESIAESLALDVDLQSIEEEAKEPTNKGNTLEYEMNFYGNKNDLIDFLSELEGMMYMIKIYEIQFEDTATITDAEEVKMPNITIKIKLYVK
ncbi:MAG: hypothetical protein ACD_51C00053G0007 [uncultured bacterium]|nr:MAG: hypothetical protein ACD_51C00053G0007 [uncultured bacterium]OGJ46875.1 MAG: hypothetical protein A2244_02985 [Candidatus Peregrinibacteria bacterium RIFOXYA2_FULL_41_18]OGJ48009.1 MAG: hypothetical protein A2344_01830 [Candidatus Peregrinibacteria bacterium RIFOXYB12_FULL_41_12]OGJ53259.1 MAG: hypothetical protein A2448_04315 [Candidatus Peregrinibacteria bacterium RIFOXYC2_FULL_41_22]OGJ54329.1 MAG: hypothetical protein A2336_01340 [Candidatus Peregrinibacteria bacterium RIFOXYB2_FULL